ncbi:ABC transporter ATP-binding protein [Sporomusa termitida]|uniref:Aliphatic sulfonates import ATP-binding protein SsuB n=1 Tax=Sporomusa termitida TaxID=2377 RepID=A0A517DWR8_9FIRM|nr:ABC transporter ATP-binding protein [Sporomusa termitida]QDR81787.1 Aliphatic sulfonates import ATP-binding protein SsuB [Sporomusa termitida]
MGFDLHINALSKSFWVGSESIPVLDNITLDIKEGEFVSIVGHSGCGKSTLLKIIAGLVEYSAGTVLCGGQDLRESDVHRGMIFQDHRLLPWLTVAENIGFGLYGLAEQEKQGRIREHIELVGLKGFEKAYPHQLSGGMAQRTAIARAFVHKPDILLLDEPFGALDALTRIQMQDEVLKIWEQQKTTMILVTHDIDEAIYLGDRVVINTNRPASIKKIFTVDLARPRERTGHYFSLLKAQIMQEFFDSKKRDPEYYL